VIRTLALDRRTSVVGAASVAFAVLAAIAGWAGLVPASGATALVIVAAAIVLRVAWSYAAKASSPASARVVQLVSNVGLGVSAVTLLAVVPRITAVGGVPLMLTDTAAQLWTLALLTLAGYGMRTFGWRVYAGTFLTGFLALTGLARFVGRPLIERFGTSDAATLGLWIPLTEEAIKLIPVAVVLFAALRRSDRRPSALDVMLLGAWAGAGVGDIGPRYILADCRACDLVLLSDGGPRAGVRLAGRASRAPHSLGAAGAGNRILFPLPKARAPGVDRSRSSRVRIASGAHFAECHYDGRSAGICGPRDHRTHGRRLSLVDRIDCGRCVRCVFRDARGRSS